MRKPADPTVDFALGTIGSGYRVPNPADAPGSAPVTPYSDWSTKIRKRHLIQKSPGRRTCTITCAFKFQNAHLGNGDVGYASKQLRRSPLTPGSLSFVGDKYFMLSAYLIISSGQSEGMLLISTISISRS
jgi:hypothetical protein